jgi:hypothetical protein
MIKEVESKEEKDDAAIGKELYPSIAAHWLFCIMNDLV